MRCNNGTATSLHFPVAAMPERSEIHCEAADAKFASELLAKQHPSIAAANQGSNGLNPQ
jgi:hypothetical protein